MRLVSLLTVAALVKADGNEDLDFFDRILSEDLPPKGEASGNEIEDSADRDFKEFDFNKDGQIDALEISARFGAEVNAVDLFYFFSHADKDASGTVNFPEYIGYVRFTSGQAA